MQTIKKQQILLGFIISAILTLVSYYLVQQGWLKGNSALYILGAFAVAQAFAQLTLFLQLGKETSPKWNLLTFLFMLAILVIVVSGSIWIMISINYNLMPAMEGM